MLGTVQQSSGRSSPSRYSPLMRRRRGSIKQRERHDFFRKFSPLSSQDLLCGTKQAHASDSKGSSTSRPFILDPTGRRAYYWLVVSSIAMVYFSWSIILRIAFLELQQRALWVLLDSIFAAVYFIDVFVQARTSYLREGILEDDPEKMRQQYQRTWRSRVDTLAAVPLDWLYMVLMLRYPPAYLHCFKLLKVYCVWQLFDRTESRSHYPNVCRVFFLMQNLLVIIHWNACLYYLLSQWIGVGSDQWVYPAWNETHNVEWGTLSRKYIYSFYWSTLTLTTIGELPQPETNLEYLFVTADYLVGMLMFATLVGNVGSIIANIQKSRTKFQSKMDQIKRYMKSTKVPYHLQERVIKWFDYLWTHGHPVEDQQALNALPDKLKAEIGIHVHFETLKKVDFFEECEHGLLWELVLRLRTQVYSPGEFVCRKGDVGREMYIVNTGRLEVLDEEEGEVVREMAHGDYFGEISVLNLGTSQRRRTAFVRSLGYSSLLYLSQSDLIEVLQDYPKTKDILIAKGRKRLGHRDPMNHTRADMEGARELGMERGFSEDYDDPVVEEEEPPMELRTVADQVLDVHTRLSKMEGLLRDVLQEVRLRDQKRNRPPIVHSSRKVSCQM